MCIMGFVNDTGEFPTICSVDMNISSRRLSTGSREKTTVALIDTFKMFPLWQKCVFVCVCVCGLGGSNAGALLITEVWWDEGGVRPPAVVVMVALLWLLPSLVATTCCQSLSPSSEKEPPDDLIGRCGPLVSHQEFSLKKIEERLFPCALSTAAGWRASPSDHQVSKISRS